MALSTYAADLLTGVEFDWEITKNTVLAAITGYLLKTIGQNNKSELLTLNKNN
jgi:hypothetical protein